MTTLTRVVIPHDDKLDYHEWITHGRRVKADCLGRWNPRMHEANWTWWSCNNMDCAALGFVSDDAARVLLDEPLTAR